jgi:catechol 2,3-dioxygenase-like lactoylglutathione lyase family enzyme
VSRINHVGMTVPHLEPAIEWYCRVLELTLVAGPIECDRSTRGAERRRQIFGPSWGGMRIAHLLGTNGAGIELFEFTEPPVTVPDTNFPFSVVGLHHVAVTVEDFDATIARVLADGGRQRCDS